MLDHFVGLVGSEFEVADVERIAKLVGGGFAGFTRAGFVNFFDAGKREGLRFDRGVIILGDSSRSNAVKFDFKAPARRTRGLCLCKY
jgi:hypothetical protein